MQTMEDEEKRQKQREYQREYRKKRMANETSEQRQKRLEDQRQRRLARNLEKEKKESDEKLSMTSDEVLEDKESAKLLYKRNWQRNKMANETPEEREKRLKRLRDRYANMTEEQRKQRAEYHKMYQKIRYANDPEFKERKKMSATIANQKKAKEKEAMKLKEKIEELKKRLENI